MRKFFFFVLACLLVIGLNQIPGQQTDVSSVKFEILPLPPGLTFIDRPLFREDGRDSLDFWMPDTLDGGGSWRWHDSGIYTAWPKQTYSFITTGTAPKIKVIFYFGYGIPASWDAEAADTTKMYFTAIDSTDIDAAGFSSHQVANVIAARHQYLKFRAKSGNGSDTKIVGRITRSRF